MNHQDKAKLLKKRAMDALLETMGTTYPHADPDYQKPFGEKGTEMDQNHTDAVVIPAKDLTPPESVEDAEFFKTGDPSMNPVAEEVREHEFFKEAPDFEMVRASDRRPAYIVPKQATDIQPLHNVLGRYGYRYTGRFTDDTHRFSKGRDEYIMIYPQKGSFAQFTVGKPAANFDGKLPEIEDKVALHHNFERPAMASTKVAAANTPDPGEGEYDFEHEAHVREEIKQWAQYAEESDNTDKLKPYDPAGKYLCGTCDMREGTNQCMRVEGPISFDKGSCRLFHLGDPESDPPMRDKFPQEDVKYGEREGGFQCGNCEYGAKAAAPDSEGRPSWCSFWGTHIVPTACCSEWDESDKKLVHIEGAKTATYVAFNRRPVSVPRLSEIKNHEDFCWVYHPNYGFFFSKGMEGYHFHFFRGSGKGTKTTEVIPYKLYDDCNRGYAYVDHDTKTVRVKPSSMLVPYLKVIPEKVLEGFKAAFPGFNVYAAGGMMASKYANGDLLYHVTYTSKVPKIKKQGIRPLQTTNWVKGTGERYGTGEIYAFEHPNDAVRWASKMAWEFFVDSASAKISIVVFRKGDEDWQADTNDPVSQLGRRGGWLKYAGAVPADRIVRAVPLDIEMVRALVQNKEVKLAASADKRQEKFEALHRKWKSFRDSVKDLRSGLAPMSRPHTLEFMKRKASDAIELARRLQARKPEGDALFEGVDVTFENVFGNLAKGIDRLENVLRHIPDLEGEWAHRAEYDERQLKEMFEFGVNDIGIGFHNLAVEYYYMTAPRDANGRVIQSSTQSYGTGMPMGGLSDAPEDEEDEDDNTVVASFDITASFDVTAADYMPMFAQFIAAKPDLSGAINTEINWAKQHLKKADRITWYLRWVRLYLEKRWAAGRTQAIQQMFDRDMAAYSKKNPIAVDDIPTDLGSWKRSLDHWLSLTDKAVQNKVFGYETMAQLYNDFTRIENEIKEQQESERRIIKHNEDDEDIVFMQFPNGWQWVWLQRASCSAEAAAMGHCGNSPRSNSDDTILSLRQPVVKTDQTLASPHLTFILDANHVIGEMKGRNNQKPTAKYHPYIIALLKDPRIKGVKGGGYKPENNFKLSDLTQTQKQEIEQANPQVFQAPESVAAMAEAMGLDEDSYDQANGLFVVRKWKSVRNMVRDLGNGDADEAMDFALQEHTEEVEGVGTVTIADEELPGVDDIATELSNNLSVGAMEAMVAELRQKDDWVLDGWLLTLPPARRSNSYDFTNPMIFNSLMRYVGQRAPQSPTWQHVLDAYRQGRVMWYRSQRIGDLEYLIEHDIYEMSDGSTYTEFRYGPDFSENLQWTAEPCWEVITLNNAQRLLEDSDVDHDISQGQIGELSLNAYSVSDYGDSDNNDDAYDLVDKWYTEGFPREEDERQMSIPFQSSLLKKAFVPVKETPRFLPPRDDMRRHLDEEAQDQVMEGVMDGVQPNQPSPRKPIRPQIDPNVTVDPLTTLMGEVQPNPNMPQIAALEGEVLTKRTGNWKLYLWEGNLPQLGDKYREIKRPAPKGKVWYVGDKANALPIIKEFGLTRQEEDLLLDKGAVDLPGMMIRLTNVDYFANPEVQKSGSLTPAVRSRTGIGESWMTD